MHGAGYRLVISETITGITPAVAANLRPQRNRSASAAAPATISALMDHIERDFG